MFHALTEGLPNHTMIKYRDVRPSEYRRLAEIHLSAFEGFFLTTLGIGFLRVYYRTCLSDKSTIAVCACSLDEKIVGFATGSIFSKGYHKNILLGNLAAFSIALLGVLLKKPASILRLIRNLDKTKNIKDKGEYAELLSIAVLPDHVGHGIGRQLLLEFENQVAQRGGIQVALTTDSIQNDTVLNFYTRSGYKVFYSFTSHPNRQMTKMIKAVNRQQGFKENL